MKRVRATYLALLMSCLLLVSISGSAQTSTTGNIEGAVSDTNGALIPNATVVLSGPTLIRPQSSTSDENGVYRFLAVPPGEYAVKVEASEGFERFEQSDVKVSLSKTTSLDIALPLKGGGSESKPKPADPPPTAPTSEDQKLAQTVERGVGTKSKYSVADLTIRERVVDGITILDLEGKITDSGGGAALRNAVRGLLDEGQTRILLNFERVSEVDESGIGEMVFSHKATEEKNGQLKMVNISKSILDLLAITKFIVVFDRYDSEGEALSKFNP